MVESGNQFTCYHLLIFMLICCWYCLDFFKRISKNYMLTDLVMREVLLRVG